MPNIKYVSGSMMNTEIELDGNGVYIGTANALRGFVWEYELSTYGLSSAYKGAREVEVEFQFNSLQKANECRRVFDGDVYYRKPGKLMFDNEWETRVYVTDIEIDTVFHEYAKGSATVILLDGLWRKSEQTAFTTEATEDEYLDYEYDFSFDLGSTVNASTVENGSNVPSDFKLTIFGACDNPQITIGGNTYIVNVDVPDGSFLTIDSLTKEITVTSITGDVLNCFGNAVRGSGENSGQYIFQKIEPGSSTISWDGSFAFNITIYRQESGVPWI